VKLLGGLKMADMVNKPPHYNKGKVECLDYIRQQLGSGFPYYLEGNIIKYLHRHRFKGTNIECLEKGHFYYKELIDYYKNL
tara:strand:- start:172 stop:414 length:243 start_codon:yes stop_codon:yes gene_type:complete